MPPGVKLVFVGEAVGDESARCGHYYSHASNSFWDDLHASGLTPELLGPEQDTELPRYGIGLTDVVKDLTNSQVNWRVYLDEAWAQRVDDLRKRILAVRPRFVCFNSYGIASRTVQRHPLFGRLMVSFAGADAWAVPDSSWLARSHRPKRLEILKRLADRLTPASASAPPCGG